MKKIETGRLVASVICALLFLSCIVPAKGQINVSLPYYCSFEDSTENSLWVMNSGPDGKNCRDKWFISSSTAYDGLNSLYISVDSGINPHYGIRQPNVVVAYRPIILPIGVACDLSFDWKNLAGDKSGLYVCLVNNSYDSISISSSGIIPPWVGQTNLECTKPDGTTTYMLQGERDWSSASCRIDPIMTPNRRFKLAFVWVNNSKDSVSNPLGACIDNIQITSNQVKKPEKLTVESYCDSIKVSWDGNYSSYDLEYRTRGSVLWRRITTSEEKYTFSNMREGGYDFRVRAIGFSNTPSAWVSSYSAIVFCPENHCINYIDMTRTNGVKCYVGQTRTTGVYNLVEAVIDNGPDDMESRQTVHWGQDQKDIRTKNGLATIPVGSVVSGRLGNWMTGAEAERIEYSFTVDSLSDILLLKYAVVLEDPLDHDDNQKPKFTLEILDEDGISIDPTCGAADFYADYTRSDWNSVRVSDEVIVTWKDWATLGLNLTNHIGQTLTIRLTTQDCTEGGHFGYAYFSLDCTEGKIKGVSCGDAPVIELEAPEGFNYKWSNSDNLSFSSNKQRITVDATDISTYYCECSFIENNGCSFTLSTVVEPRFPKASFSYELARKNCENVVKFKNESCVVTRINGNDVETNEPCESYIWKFGSSSSQSMEEEPEFTFPKTGGTFPVTLSALMSDGNCEDDTIIYVTVAPVVEHLDTLRETICFGASRQFCNQYLMASDTVVCVQKDIYGCDSTTVLCLTVLPQLKDIDSYDTICFGDVYSFDGKTYTESGEYERWFSNEADCRAVEVMHLTVKNEITFTCAKEDVIDAPNTGSITIEGAPAGYEYSLNGVMNAPLNGLSGGNYTVVVYYDGCESAEQEVFIDQNCLELELGEISPVCADDEKLKIDITINGGIVSEYSVRYGDKASEAGFKDVTGELDPTYFELTLPDSCRPDIYMAEIVFHDVICGDTVIPIEFTVYYPIEVVKQKWNNVLAVTNSKYNGGYDFAAFQWYRNRLPIAGEKGSYIYLGEDVAFDTTDVYYVMLTRVDDGVTLPTCDIVPTVRTDINGFPVDLTSTMMGVRSKVGVKNAGDESKVEIYDVNGRFYGSEKIDGNQSFTAPSVEGIYIVRIIKEENIWIFKIIVIP